MAHFSQELPREEIEKMFRFFSAEYILNRASVGNILPRIVLTLMILRLYELIAHIQTALLVHAFVQEIANFAASFSLDFFTNL